MKAIHTLTLVCLLGANLLPSIAAQNPHIEYHSTAQGLKYRVIQAGNGIKPKLQ
ncbi:MAG: hypothetical protein Q4B82_07875 [Alysiella sp.]|uniref:hypothetical protein n=1 Tax=Alysiella sp. TaxID=1872483 RepID=UPI0026DC51D4|nr:hypothetical protein [Alysiella sp.]MDO4434479.1 hypothetical protein [Alysiella sp.]